MGNQVKWPDGSITNEPWSYWLFKLFDGREITAGFTNKEIEKMKEKYPEVKWT